MHGLLSGVPVMDLVVVTLTAPTPAAGSAISPQILADILWANADPAEGLEHINIRAGPGPGSYTVGLFLCPADLEAAVRALRVCHRATRAAPPLAGWETAYYRRASVT